MHEWIRGFSIWDLVVVPDRQERQAVGRRAEPSAGAHCSGSWHHVDPWLRREVVASRFISSYTLWVDSLLDRLDIVGQSEDLRPLTVSALLLAKDLAPDRHLSSAMRRNRSVARNEFHHDEARKLAVVSPTDLSQVC